MEQNSQKVKTEDVRDGIRLAIENRPELGPNPWPVYTRHPELIVDSDN